MPIFVGVKRTERRRGVTVALLMAPIARSESLNLLLVSDDAQPGTLARDNQIFTRVLAALGEEFNLSGYTIVEEAIATLELNLPAQRRRTEAELITIARAIWRPPIDAVVIFQVFSKTSPVPLSSLRRPELRVTGRVLTVWSGQQVAVKELGRTDLPLLPNSCDSECETEEVGGRAQVLARDLGRGLVDKLTDWRRLATGCERSPISFSITLDGFDVREQSAMEDTLRSLGCSANLRPLGGSKYEYRNSAGIDALGRALRVMCNGLGMSAQIQMGMDNNFKITKISTR